MGFENKTDMGETTPAEKGHILVVDDNGLNRKKLSSYLEKEGYRVSLANDGRKTLEMLREEPFDAVLLDLMMPEVDGFGVLEVIHNDPELREIPVIVISSVEDMDGVAKCIELGAEDFLPENFNPVLLNARLTSCLRKKKLRELERMYMNQELMLHQNEKLALLGKLSAGMAHELNNPSAAVQRGAAQLHENFEQLQQRYLQLGKLHLNDEKIDSLMHLNSLARERARTNHTLDPITRSDLEAEMEKHLEAMGLENPWETAPTLVGLGFGRKELETLEDVVSSEHFPIAAEWLCSSATIYNLTAEIDQGAEQMTEIVKALKNYTYMDQAPIQNVDIHEGLENTLLILRSKLAPGVTVKRSYQADLPQIQAYGSQLNQVWTNLIDNAIDAVAGKGEIRLRTRLEAPWVIVEVEDDGPGISPENLDKIYDPFFTTKQRGKGTGLGLNISHNIIVHKHNGQLRVTSNPGMTCFEVKLPLRLAVENR